MRYVLPAVLAAAALVPGIGGAAAAKKRHVRSTPKRAAARVSLHVSRHNVLTGSEMTVTGRVSPRGSQRVKVVVHGPSAGLLHGRTGRGGRFTMHWGLHGTGIYELRAYGVHDRLV